ncbi:hypothetical protein J1N35_022819 [Gossypium stocksii]|uniref:Secreted protein n=1 Tax=Gossypium stocksii TaxID=47602 RepID=A0A9D3VHG6_9ROSI|nr:hypothetical protein J1N35_022819 [Gossypium stocksii]
MKVCLLLKFLLLLNGNSEAGYWTMTVEVTWLSLIQTRTQGKKFQRGAQASIGRIAHCSLMSLRSHEKNQFFSVMREVFMFVTQVVLYEDELADNKVSLLTVKVRYLRHTPRRFKISFKEGRKMLMSLGSLLSDFSSIAYFCSCTEAVPRKKVAAASA